MSRIFISYKRVDKDKVFKIKDQIESALGEKCWIDLDGIESDALFVNVIIKAIDNAQVVLFMYSQSHTLITDYENDWTIRELSYANTERKRIVFINLDNSPLTKWFKFMYNQKQQVDATSHEDLSKLIQDINGWLCCTKEPSIKVSSTKSHPTKPIRSKSFRLGGFSIKMVRVQKGTFVMGDIPHTENLSISDSSYPHEVQLTSDYYICEVPVTQGLWYYLMGEQPSRFNFNDNAPVDSVSWDDCMDFIQKLNFALGVEFRLPSEAEWEFAARGGVFSRNHIFSGGDELDEVGWYRNNSDCMTHEVAQKNPNELGIYDMSGNVWEWCSDFYSDMDETTVIDPQGPKSGTQHVYRGGCWCETDDCCVISRRPGLHDFKSFGGLGLRLAMSVS